MNRLITIITLLIFSSCSKQVTYISQVDPEYYRIDNKSDAEDKEIEALIAPYKARLDETMNDVIGTVEKGMSKNKPNSPLNNWVADVIFDQAALYVDHIDFAVQNYGGIRVPELAGGPVTVGKIYELMPFDNMVTVLTADGATVKMLLDRIADYGGWPVSKGTRFKVNDGKAEDIIINGQPFDPDGKYTFALPDYVANGGDNCFFLEKAERQDLKLLIRDAMLDHIKANGGNIAYNDEIRIFNP